jgi:hypothetical protein
MSEALGEASGQHVVPVREHHFVAVYGVVVEAVGGEVVDPRAVLLLGPVLEVLAYSLGPVLVPALSGQGLLCHVAVRGIRIRLSDHVDERGIEGVDVGDELGGGGIRQPLPVRTVVGDGAAVRLVPAHGELNGPHAERIRGGGDRRVGDPVDPRRPHVGGEPEAAVGDDAAPDSVSRLEHEHPLPVHREESGRRETLPRRRRQRSCRNAPSPNLSRAPRPRARRYWITPRHANP